MSEYKLQFIQAMLDLRVAISELRAGIDDLDRAITRVLEITVLEI